MSEKKVKGIGLLSGGLDSLLAVRVLRDQSIDLIGIMFSTPFFGPKPGVDPSRAAGIPVRVVDISERHLEMLKKPIYGYGSCMNPCIDCHALMLNEAGKIMESESADFLFTGEVLGQRPMSQRRDSLRSVEKLSGYPGLILRPLSAKLLPETIVEARGLVDRSMLLDIHGRSRKRQEALAVHYGLKEYPQPGGGCMLTKEGFSNRLRELLNRYPQATAREVEMLKWGRQFVLPDGGVFIVGRNRKDNETLTFLASPEDHLFRALDHPGPIGLFIASPASDADLSSAASIVASYSDAPFSQTVRIGVEKRGATLILTETARERDRFKLYMV